MVTQKFKNLVLVVSVIVSSNGVLTVSPEAIIDGSAVTEGVNFASRVFVEALTKTIEAAEALNTEEIVSKDEPLRIEATLNDGCTFINELPSATKLPVFIKVAKRFRDVSPALTAAVNFHALNLLNDIKEILGKDSIQDVIEILETKEIEQPSDSSTTTETQTEAPAEVA